MGILKPIIKTFRLTADQDQRFKRLKGFRHKWTFSEIVIQALEDQLKRSDEESLFPDSAPPIIAMTAPRNTLDEVLADVIRDTAEVKEVLKKTSKKPKVKNDPATNGGQAATDTLRPSRTRAKIEPAPRKHPLPSRKVGKASGAKTPRASRAGG